MKHLRALVGMLAFAMFPVASAAQSAAGEPAIPEPAANTPGREISPRSEGRMSCADIASAIAEAGRSRSDPGTAPPPGWELDCAFASRVPPGAALELRRAFWSPALRSWEFWLRCVHASDCIPFLVRTLPGAPAPALSSSSQARSPESPPGAGKPAARAGKEIVNAGDEAILVWDQDGIRIVVPVICLDRGGIGSSVRARVKNGNRILRAEVVGAGELRTP